MVEPINWSSILALFSFLSTLSCISFIYLYLKLKSFNANIIPQDEYPKEISPSLPLPKFPNYFISLIGSGSQFLLLTYFLSILLATISVSSKFLIVAGLLFFMISCFISGYISGSFQQYLNQKNWLQNIIFSSANFYGTSILLVSLLSLISSNLPSISRLILLLVLLMIISMPITFYGQIYGKNYTNCCPHLANNTNIKAELPKPINWYAIMSTFLIIYIQVYIISNSSWTFYIGIYHSICFVSFTLTLLFEILSQFIVTYYVIASKNPYSMWTSFLQGAAKGVFLFLFLAISTISSTLGFEEIILNLAYLLIVCWGVFLTLGSLGVLSSFFIYQHLMSKIKLTV
ncbi:unnamed protein product [Blepharisma stoltei]|uniref:Transmembrane 9 superfamily member n=1 Tax=Blepharisma stoltei TaxID=1481888 RepID=A0AAU9JFL4_9CILI|nr:unnamed protein product [Blepharisma stoltei]